MREMVYVSSGEVKVAGKETILRSTPAGSCVVVAAYDRKKNIGAMAHIMLPGRSPKKSPEETKYAADAIDRMIMMMTEAGAEKADIETCLAGAGNVLKREDDTICQANIDSVTSILKEKAIPVRAAALGGTTRRTVSMDVENGCVSLAEGDEKEKTLWQPGGERFN
ncbi:MAG: chemotaxis protein CheD [Phycisphaerae bacterium]|nr:chemotaxis protein CheD [Phycisphaerae bacterium]